ncbi:MAG TPA: asparagine synthase-related protein [Candidatus Acidoferrales bacterium]|nr:asparagine synthase-related protein [Candidatus Acidoferrales bacterium]
MSGIVGIVYNDGRAVNRQLLRHLTQSLAFCGPDAQEVWTFGCAGLGHTLLRSCPQDRHERQPASLDQQTWIAADARLDAREELVEALRAQGHESSLITLDCELLLHAYAAWGEDCVEHVLGDFVFVIWDGRRQKLFCACDHFGIKTLYFAELRNCLVFSNTLECVRLHPDVSDRLNEAAIADFLLFGLNYDKGTTSFVDIRRLPPAHTLQWSTEGLECRRYWMPPTDGHIRYRRRSEYVEHFSELLKKAVADRLPADSAGIFLSGGLDSSSLAATACELRGEKFPELKLHAFTTTLSDDGRDSDLAAARVVAKALQIPLHTTSLEGAGPFDGWDDARIRWPEPIDDPFARGIFAEFREIASETRVVFSGEGSDNLMEFEMWPRIRMLWRGGQIGQLATDIAEHAVRRIRAPDGLRGPLRRMGRLIGRRKPRAIIPAWLSSEMVSRLELRSRWENPSLESLKTPHPVHPRGYESLFLPHWRRMFMNESPEVTRQPVEVRYPFLDLRLAEFLLAIPAMPWFFRKHLMREAMRGRLPESIRMRAKRPLRRDPLISAMRKGGAGLFEGFSPAEELSRYVNTKALPSIWKATGGELTESNLRPWCLNFWLKSCKRIGYKIAQEAGLAEAASSNR